MTPSLVVPRLAAGPYLLRAFEAADLALVEEAAADPYIPLVTTVPCPFTPEAGLAFIARQHVRARDGEGYSMVIVDRVGGRAVGSIGLWLRDVAAGRASLGYWVVSSARGGRAAGHALIAVAGWALEDLGFRRLELFVEPGNVASIRTAERAGFVWGGLLRGWLEIGRVRRDVVVFSRLADELTHPL
jgi:RimJ/RimL family protein N-acetyltransferase